jgi:ATPase subunit of ABC transporter with duplicated ATPase domains
MLPVIVCTDLSFYWPDGTTVFTGLNAAFNPGRTGLIGANGSGKSTLLRLITGELTPKAGTIGVSGEVGYLPQNLTLDTAATVADLLGISPALDAIRAIEDGDVSPATFAAVGDDWDIADRALGWLGRLGMAHLTLNDPVDRLSGGETIMVALSALFLRRPAIILLDEPTNNLDLDARERLYAAVRSWPGVMVIVSHDRELLERVDQIAELHDGTLATHGGTLTDYERTRDAEQQAALRAVASAAAEVKRERRDLVEAATKQARRDRYGKRQAADGSMPRIVAQARKRHAQETSGKTRGLHEQRIEAARHRLEEAEEAVRDEPAISIDLPGTAVPAGRTVLHVTGLADAAWPPKGTGRGGLDELIIRGPERVALTGPNGAGKTTLLRAITGIGPLNGINVTKVTIGYLPQRLDILDEDLTIAENVRRAAPAASPNDVRRQLARFGFRAERADQPARSLSGGERFRAVLATLLLADAKPQLLLLDEPTNNLDLTSVRLLTQALECYRGAVIVASHDRPFLESLGVTRWLRLDPVAGISGELPLTFACGESGGGTR